MMEWMNDWLKQIVLLVLMATFFDLLLPNHSMERYVKLVMGLVIIMAMVTPILEFISKDFNLARITFDLPELENKKMMSLEEIQQRSEELQKENQKKREQTLGKWLETQLEKKFPVDIVQTQVQLSDEATPTVQKVHLVARQQPPTSFQMEPVRPIQPVDLSSTSTQLQRQPSTEIPLAAQIRTYIAKTWQIQAENVQITWETAY